MTVLVLQFAMHVPCCFCSTKYAVSHTVCVPLPCLRTHTGRCRSYHASFTLWLVAGSTLCAASAAAATSTCNCPVWLSLPCFQPTLQLILRSINNAKSAFLSVTFRSVFFETYHVFDAAVVQTAMLMKVWVWLHHIILKKTRQLQAVLRYACFRRLAMPRVLNSAVSVITAAIHEVLVLGLGTPARPTCKLHTLQHQMRHPPTLAHPSIAPCLQCSENRFTSPAMSLARAPAKQQAEPT